MSTLWLVTSVGRDRNPFSLLRALYGRHFGPHGCARKVVPRELLANDAHDTHERRDDHRAHDARRGTADECRDQRPPWRHVDGGADDRGLDQMVLDELVGEIEQTRDEPAQRTGDER